MKFSLYLSTHFFKVLLPTLLLILSCFPGIELLRASQNHNMAEFANMPINIVEDGVTPRVVINTSNDHQLYFKAYNDYSDLDGDNIPETTYKHNIDYYGYFDAYKCYEYDTTSERFEPISETSDKYCNNGVSGQWSGNFLNWVAMSRIDAVRKVLFGGHRRVDTNEETVLERAYVPHDAHSWAKYYSGDDIPKLTPFTRTDYNCDDGNQTDAKCDDGSGGVDLTKVGITLCNTTDVTIGNYGANKYFSQYFTEPPLIKAAIGNHSLWASNERWQCTWSGGSPVENHSANNGNIVARSDIYAHANSPHFDDRLGIGNYNARVQVCVDTLVGKEKCKSYPGPDTIPNTADDILKPIGLLQTYGDDDQMLFGMVAGSYIDHASGGVLMRNVGSMSDEIDVDATGRFSKVHSSAGGTFLANDNQAEGLINSFSLFRITGYDGKVGDYENNQGDNCKWSYSDYDDLTATNKCWNWGNPFSEIYLQSLNYLAGGGVIGAYRSNPSVVIDGLNQPLNFIDPIDEANYCANLFVINLNTSDTSFDSDEIDGPGNSYGPKSIWDPAVLPGDKTSKAMTDAVGNAEGIHGNYYYVGESNIGSGENQLCTSKEVTSFGSVGGVCPETPRLGGSYKIAGLAYYAHTRDIRPDNATGNRDRQGMQTVDTFSVSMATGAPIIKIPNPSAPLTDSLVTILPACRDQRNVPNGNCSLVNFKIVSQKVDEATAIATGTFYINWEVGEMGGDYDQDMWGTLNYVLDANANTLTVTTQVHAQSSGGLMGFGYVIDGTNDDGFHAHSGINGFTHVETIPVETGSPDCTPPGCVCRSSGHGSCDLADSASSTKVYNLGTSTTEALKDPLWYAAKYGGFIDSNENNLPDLQTEWDNEINSTGATGQDGIPDNYFFATNPQELENSLTRVFNAILERTSSGTAAAVVSSNVRGEGALFQAYYEPLRKDATKDASWIGTLQALWLDKYGYTRQDCTPPADMGIDANGECVAIAGSCVPNGRLDNYCVDQVVETYFDDLQGRTRMRIFESNAPDTYTAYSMQGVVTSYNAGSVTMAPNSMEGMVTFTANTLTITPYEIHGTVKAYDATTGVAQISIADGDWTGPDGQSFDAWNIGISSGPATGFSNSSISLASTGAGTTSLTVSPAGAWIAIDDILTLTTKNVIGASGQNFATWSVTCLEGDLSATGTITGSLQLNNSGISSATIVTDYGDFSSCSRARLATYNLRGDEGDEYSTWEVSNLQTNQGRGTSSTTMELTNNGSLSFTVLPIDNWLTPGDQVLVANYTTTSKELYQIGYLWNAREELYLPGVSDAVLAINRNYSTISADNGRFITTWIDDNLNNKIDAGEYRNFEKQIFSDPTTPVSYTFFDVSSQAEAEDLIDYVRGIEKSGSRNRTIKYAPEDTSAHTMRLGDIVNSTPTTVASPQEAFDLLYNDMTYRTFRKQYKNRRIVVYAGGNDGLIHAFNGGFYNVVDVNGDGLIEYSTSGFKHDGSAAIAHPLGSELWAYAPMNLLPHLQWLKSTDYKSTHVSYIDAKPRVFDAKIFPVTPDHPEGWGTVMVVGMNLGGGKMSMAVDNDNNPATPAVDVTRRSAYVVFDITNPEIKPVVLGEIVIPDESFTSVYPAVIADQDVGSQTTCEGDTVACNNWYLMFGNGPNSLTTYESNNQSAKMYLFDLKQLITGTPSPSITTHPAGCTVLTPSTTSAYNMISCDSGIANSFMGTPSVVDWELDFKANTAYFGLVGGTDSTSGRVMRFGLNNSANPNEWTAPVTLYDSQKPVFAQIVPSIDNLKNHWLFFGSGRYFSILDKTSTETQRLFGIKDHENEPLHPYPVTTAKLLDVTDAEIYTDGTIQSPGIQKLNGDIMTEFKEIEKEIDLNADGWFLDLPPIVGTAGAVPSTRNTTRSALAGGVLFTSVFQPSEDPCSGEGLSRLYGLYYKTGTAYPSIPPIFNSSIRTVNGEVKYLSNRYIDLGRGAATSPTLHSGSGSGNSSVQVFSQMSTGEMVQTKAQTVLPIRAGRISWRDQ